jgi:hypothetical protein
MPFPNKRPKVTIIDVSVIFTWRVYFSPDFDAVFIQNDHLNGLLIGHKQILVCYFEKVY